MGPGKKQSNKNASSRTIDNFWDPWTCHSLPLVIIQMSICSLTLQSIPLMMWWSGSKGIVSVQWLCVPQNECRLPKGYKILDKIITSERAMLSLLSFLLFPMLSLIWPNLSTSDIFFVLSVFGSRLNIKIALLLKKETDSWHWRDRPQGVFGKGRQRSNNCFWKTVALVFQYTN